MASDTDVVKKLYLYYNMSVLCLCRCVCMSVANIGPYIKTRSSKFPKLYNARSQQSSRTVELVDHTYDGLLTPCLNC